MIVFLSCFASLGPLDASRDVSAVGEAVVLVSAINLVADVPSLDYPHVSF